MLILFLILTIFIYLAINFAPYKKNEFNYIKLKRSLEGYYFSIIFTGLFVTYIFWVRLILKRLPKDLNNITYDLFQSSFIGLLFLFFFF